MIEYCDNCHLVFESTFGPRFNPPPGLRFSVGGFTCVCPRCGHTIDGSGEYEVDANGIVQFLSRPFFTIPVLEQIKQFAETAIEGNYDTEQAFEAAKKINPIIAFIISCIPRTNKEIRIHLAWLLTLLVPILYDKYKKAEPTTSLTNINYNLTVVLPDRLPDTSGKQDDSTAHKDIK
jgi:rubredoxin